MVEKSGSSCGGSIYVFDMQDGSLPPRKPVGGQGGRAVAKLLYAAGSVAFACLAVSLAVKSAVAGVFSAVSFSAGATPVGIPAATVSLGFGVGAYYSLKLSAHFFREAIRV